MFAVVGAPVVTDGGVGAAPDGAVVAAGGVVVGTAAVGDGDDTGGATIGVIGAVAMDGAVVVAVGGSVVAGTGACVAIGGWVAGGSVVVAGACVVAAGGEVVMAGGLVAGMVCKAVGFMVIMLVEVGMPVSTLGVDAMVGVVADGAVVSAALGAAVGGPMAEVGVSVKGGTTIMGLREMVGAPVTRTVGAKVPSMGAKVITLFVGGSGTGTGALVGVDGGRVQSSALLFLDFLSDPIFDPFPFPFPCLDFTLFSEPIPLPMVMPLPLFLDGHSPFFMPPFPIMPPLALFSPIMPPIIPPPFPFIIPILDPFLERTVGYAVMVGAGEGDAVGRSVGYGDVVVSRPLPIMPMPFLAVATKPDVGSAVLLPIVFQEEVGMAVSAKGEGNGVRSRDAVGPEIRCSVLVFCECTPE
jgi:hypothetical protein